MPCFIDKWAKWGVDLLYRLLSENRSFTGRIQRGGKQ
jgi:hypothetical protein